MMRGILLTCCLLLGACVQQPNVGQATVSGPEFTPEPVLPPGTTYRDGRLSVPTNYNKPDSVVAKSDGPLTPYKEVKRPPSRLAQYQRAVAKSLRDPESARFSALRVVQTENGADALCGFVNAKNGFGGYAGNTAFFAEMIPAGKEFVAIPFMVDKVGPAYFLKRCSTTGG